MAELTVGLAAEKEIHLGYYENSPRRSCTSKLAVQARYPDVARPQTNISNSTKIQKIYDHGYISPP
jgi:hypothetical protein